MTPGRISGSVTVRNTQLRLAPKRAGRLLEPDVHCLDRQADGAHHQRESHHAAGKCRTGPAEREDDAEMVGEKTSDRSSPTEQ